MTPRPYTGWDGNAPRELDGMKALRQGLVEATDGGLFSLGSWLVRPKRGKTSPSVHGTSRALDLGWTNDGGKYQGWGEHDPVVAFCNWMTTDEVAEALRLEMLLDYWPKPYGRGWACSRWAWRTYSSRMMAGTPGGRWLHLEISPEYVKDGDYYRRTLAELLDGKPIPGLEHVTRPQVELDGDPQLPQPTLRLGSRGPAVRWVQRLVGATADGDYGPRTRRAVTAWQADHPAAGPADGIVGPRTWQAMLEAPSSSTPATSSSTSSSSTPEPEAPAAPKYPGRTLKRGSTGKAVKWVQGIVGATTDGKYGPRTEAAVKAWQAAHPAAGPADGIVGPRTWAAMSEA